MAGCHEATQKVITQHLSPILSRESSKCLQDLRLATHLPGKSGDDKDPMSTTHGPRAGLRGAGAAGQCQCDGVPSY